MPLVPRSKPGYVALNPQQRSDLERYLLQRLPGVNVNPDGNWDLGTETALQLYWQQPDAQDEFTPVPATESIPTLTTGEQASTLHANPPKVGSESPIRQQAVRDKDFSAGVQADIEANKKSPMFNQEEYESIKMKAREAADQGYNPLTAFEEFKPKRDVEREQNLKRAAGFAALGNMFKQFGDYAGLEGWMNGKGYASSVPGYKETTGIRAFDEVRRENELYDDRLSRWQNMVMAEVMRENARSDTREHQKEMQQAGFEQQDKAQERGFEYQDKVREDTQTHQYNLQKNRQGWQLHMKDIEKANREDLMIQEYALRKSLKERDYDEAIKQIQERNRLSGVQKGIVLYDDKLDRHFALDESQMNKVLAMIVAKKQEVFSNIEDGEAAPASAFDPSDFDLLNPAMGEKMSREQKIYIVAKYWDTVMNPDATVDISGTNMGGQINTTGTESVQGSLWD